MENLKINCEVELTELERVKKELEETKKKYRDLSDLIFHCDEKIKKQNGGIKMLQFWRKGNELHIQKGEWGNDNNGRNY